MNYDIEILQEVKAAVDKANELYAERYGKKILYPHVRFSNKMTRAAGIAKNTKPHSTVVFSRPIIERNDIHNFKAQTVWHEIAHVVQFELGLPSGHGRTFYQIMNDFGVAEPSRCHSYNTPKKNTVAVVCQQCNAELKIGAIQAAKLKTGTARYRHNCGGIVKLKV